MMALALQSLLHYVKQTWMTYLMSDTDISSDENCSSKQATIQVRVSFKVFKIKFLQQ